jgi:RNA polymerase sigma factor (TIGR02999 family)
LDKLIPLVDQELKKIAKSYMRTEGAGHILQATALVNEALIRLIRENIISFEDRKHFYGIVAKRMRQVLIDYANQQPPVEQFDPDIDEPDKEKAHEIRMLERALIKLGEFDERKLKVVECRFFIGLNYDEIAELLGIASITAQRDWSFAKSWLKTEMTGEAPASKS